MLIVQIQKKENKKEIPYNNVLHFKFKTFIKHTRGENQLLRKKNSPLDREHPPVTFPHVTWDCQACAGTKGLGGKKDFSCKGFRRNLRSCKRAFQRTLTNAPSIRVPSLFTRNIRPSAPTTILLSRINLREKKKKKEKVTRKEHERREGGDS